MRTWIIAGLIATTAPAAACGQMADNNPSQNNTTENNQDNNTTTQESRTVRGMLTADASGEGSVESNTVTAHTVDSDGNVEAIEGASAETDADGRYELTFDQEVEQETTILIEATEDGRLIGSCTFDAPSRDEEEVDAPPITVESTTEARVFVQARAQGDVCAGCTAADLEHRIDSRLAAVVEASAESEQEIHANLAASVYSGIEAFQTMLTHESVGVTEAELTAAGEASQRAHADLRASLAEAENQDDIEAAHDAYATAYLDAYQEAGIDAEQLATGAHAEAAVRSATEVSADQDTEASLLSESEARRAGRVTAAIEGAFEAQGVATGQVDTAGDELISSIEAASEAGSEARGQIGDAWADYSSTVRAEIESELDATQQTALTGLDAAINTAAETYASALVESGTDASSTVTALGDLEAGVVSEAHLEALTTAGLDEDAATTYLTVIFHLEAASSVSATN